MTLYNKRPTISQNHLRICNIAYISRISMSVNLINKLVLSEYAKTGDEYLIVSYCFHYSPLNQTRGFVSNSLRIPK